MATNFLEFPRINLMMPFIRTDISWHQHPQILKPFLIFRALGRGSNMIHVLHFLLHLPTPNTYLQNLTLFLLELKSTISKSLHALNSLSIPFIFWAASSRSLTFPKYSASHPWAGLRGGGLFCLLLSSPFHSSTHLPESWAYHRHPIMRQISHHQTANLTKTCFQIWPLAGIWECEF